MDVLPDPDLRVRRESRSSQTRESQRAAFDLDSWLHTMSIDEGRPAMASPRLVRRQSQRAEELQKILLQRPRQPGEGVPGRGCLSAMGKDGVPEIAGTTVVQEAVAMS